MRPRAVIDSSSRNQIFTTINDLQTYVLLDAGAACSCISLAFARRLKTKITPSSLQDKLITADGNTLQRRGTTEVTAQLGHLQLRHRFEVINGLRNNVIFGVDFLQNTHCVLDIQNSQVYFYEQAVILPLLEKKTNTALF